VQAALQGFDVVACDVEAGAGVGADEDSHGLISAVFVALNAYAFLLYIACLTAVLTALCGGLHNMSSQ
jgi:hypothetical protein